MAIQLSSNSNEALRLVIQSRPTLIGQYRQAYMQFTDRVSALKACSFNLRRIEIKLRLKKVERSQLVELIEAETNPYRLEAYQANLDLLDLDSEELMQQTQELTAQIDDAQREAKVCETLMNNICSEAGVDFASISTEEFQQYMIEETKLFQARKIAAGFLSSSTGLSQMVTEALLELPEADRIEMLKTQNDILNLNSKVLTTNSKPTITNKTLNLIDSPIKFLN